MMNSRFSGLLDFPEFEDQVHHLEVLELLLRGDEIAFSMKWAYGAGNADVWYFDGTAKKEGANYITKSVVGKKYQGSTGDDEGNDILFKRVALDGEFEELELAGTIRYKAQSFDFEGLLELKHRVFVEPENAFLPHQEDHKKVIRKQHNHKNSRKKSLFFIQSEIEDLPMPFRAYVKANRIFLSEIRQYQNLLKELNLAQNLINWMIDCQQLISFFEQQLQGVLDEDIKLRIFNYEKSDMALQLEEILDMQPKETCFPRDGLTPDQAEIVNNVDEYFYNIYQNMRSKGYKVYYAWIDA